MLSNWNGFNTALDREIACKQRCLQPCIYWKYRIWELSTEKISNGSAVLTINCANHIYMVIEEEYYWTEETFMAALGGILGLWLGIDLIVIVQAHNIFMLLIL